MKNPLSPVVPATMDRPKRIAKRLHKIFPDHPLSKCQQVTAKLYFHTDWHTLEEATKSGKRKGPFDEDMETDDVLDRMKQQEAIICRELFGLDIDEEYPFPADERNLKETANNVLLGMASSHHQKRLTNAANRRKQVISVFAISDICPTARKTPPHIRSTGILNQFVEMERMPGLLAAWWRKNIPHQMEIAEELEGYKVDPSSQISLLKFGGYWGTLCMYYAESIDWGAAMGTAYILANNYAWIFLDREIELREKIIELHEQDIEMYSEKWQKEMKSWTDKREEYITHYFYTYPRDDFFDVYRAQPRAFISNAVDWMDDQSTC